MLTPPRGTPCNLVRTLCGTRCSALCGLGAPPCAVTLCGDLVRHRLPKVTTLCHNLVRDLVRDLMFTNPVTLFLHKFVLNRMPPHKVCTRTPIYANCHIYFAFATYHIYIYIYIHIFTSVSQCIKCTEKREAGKSSEEPRKPSRSLDTRTRTLV